MNVPEEIDEANVLRDLKVSMLKTDRLLSSARF